jgi:hypothetical protein
MNIFVVLIFNIWSMGSYSCKMANHFEGRQSQLIVDIVYTTTNRADSNIIERLLGRQKADSSSRGHFCDSALIILNNLPYEGDIKDINPNDVESIKLLTQPYEQAVYGLKGMHGVVVIVIKRKKRKLYL